MKSSAYFQYYESFEKVVQKFKTAEERDNFRSKIINYGLFGVEPETLTDLENIAWDLIKDMIAAQRHRREVNQANAKQRKPEEPKQEEPASLPEPEAVPEEYEPALEKKRFKKPTVEEVETYCKERNNTINAEQFVNYYEARGWKIGNASMKDWKAAVRTWEQRRETPYNRQRSGPEWPADKLTL